MQHGRRHPDGFRVRISRRVPVRRRSPGWRGTVLAIAGDGAEFGVVRGDQLDGRRGAGVATAGPVRLSDLSGPRAGSRSRALRDAFTWICAALAGGGRACIAGSTAGASWPHRTIRRSSGADPGHSRAQSSRGSGARSDCTRGDGFALAAWVGVQPRKLRHSAAPGSNSSSLPSSACKVCMHCWRSPA